MFGIFKKKKQVSLSPEWSDAKANIDQSVHQQMQRAADLLQMQLMICTTVEDYDQKTKSKFFRGYLVGFFDSALQWADIPVNSDEQLISFISIGHGYLARPMGTSSRLFNGDSSSEPPRVFRRLQLLRGWSHEEDINTVLARAA